MHDTCAPPARWTGFADLAKLRDPLFMHRLGVLHGQGRNIFDAWREAEQQLAAERALMAAKHAGT